MLKPLSSFLLLLLPFASEMVRGELETCGQHVSDLCLEMGGKWVSGACTANFGKFEGNAATLESLMTQHFTDSFKLLIMANEFSSDNVNRLGFHNLLQGMSNQLWNNGKHILKHFVTRGGRIRNNLMLSKMAEGSTELEELEALGKALDLMKKEAESVSEAIRHASSRKHSDANPQTDSFDPEIAHFLEEELLEPYAKQIFDLAQQTNLLGAMVRDDASRGMALHLFDQHLKQ